VATTRFLSKKMKLRIVIAQASDPHLCRRISVWWFGTKFNCSIRCKLNRPLVEGFKLHRTTIRNAISVNSLWVHVTPNQLQLSFNTHFYSTLPEYADNAADSCW